MVAGVSHIGPLTRVPCEVSSLQDEAWPPLLTPRPSLAGAGTGGIPWGEGCGEHPHSGKPKRNPILCLTPDPASASPLAPVRSRAACEREIAVCLPPTHTCWIVTVPEVSPGPGQRPATLLQQLPRPLALRPLLSLFSSPYLSVGNTVSQLRLQLPGDMTHVGDPSGGQHPLSLASCVRIHS